LVTPVVVTTWKPKPFLFDKATTARRGTGYGKEKEDVVLYVFIVADVIEQKDKAKMSNGFLNKMQYKAYEQQRKWLSRRVVLVFMINSLMGTFVLFCLWTKGHFVSGE
jgi:hypothetical protein